MKEMNPWTPAIPSNSPYAALLERAAELEISLEELLLQAMENLIKEDE